MRPVTTIGSITLFFILTGCAAFTPYESSFTCPKTFNGSCVSTTTAYEASLDVSGQRRPEGEAGEKDALEDKETHDGRKSEEVKKLPPESAYFNALIKKLTGILKEPTVPVIAPPQVLRVLVLPYEGENAVLYMPRYIYLIVDEPQWVLENRLSGKGSGGDSATMQKQPFPLR